MAYIGEGQVGESRISHLLPAINQPLLHRRDPLLLLHPLLDPGDFIVRLDIELNLLSGEGTDPIRSFNNQLNCLPRPLVLFAGDTLIVGRKLRTYLMSILMCENKLSGDRSAIWDGSSRR